MLIVAQALAGLVVARPRSHIHLALPGGEAVLRWSTHAGVVAAKAQKVDPRCNSVLSGLGSKPEQEVCENRLEAAWVRIASTGNSFSSGAWVAINKLCGDYRLCVEVFGDLWIL